MSAEEQGLTRDRYLFVPRVLVFIRSGGDLLLLKGAPDKRNWPGLYNGIGGHVERGESVYEAAVREIVEETGLTVRDLVLRGIAAIDANDPGLGIIMFIFTAWADSRTAHSSPEGELIWFPVDQLPPAAEMVADLPIIIPIVLAADHTSAPPFFARYWYDSADSLRIEINGQEVAPC
jgi:8-oxo-dGTP diphosphatase